MNNFDSALGNGICQYIIKLRGIFAELMETGKCVNFLYKLNIVMLANFSAKDD